MDKLVANQMISGSLGWTFVALSWRAASAIRNFRFVAVAIGARCTARRRVGIWSEGYVTAPLNGGMSLLGVL